MKFAFIHREPGVEMYLNDLDIMVPIRIRGFLYDVVR